MEKRKDNSTRLPKSQGGNLNPIKKGEVRNPLGITTDPMVRAIKRLTQKELAELGAIVVKGDMAALEKIIKSKKSTVLHQMAASIANRVIKKGDAMAFDKLMDRLVGKVKEHVEVTGNQAGPRVVITMPSNGREVKVVPNKGEESE